MSTSRIRTRRTAPRARAARTVHLSATHAAWAARNLREGVEPHELVATLVGAAVSKALAIREIAELTASPLFVELRKTHKRLEQMQQVLRLLRELGPKAIDRRETAPPEALLEHYFKANRPCVLTRYTEGWPARSWTPESLVHKLGDPEITVVVGRDKFPADYDRRTPELARTMRMSEYVRLVRERSPTNDLYSVANNRNMDRAAFARLLDDVRIDERLFDRARLEGGTSFWLGPGGTVTPLHHDTTNILFSQLYGRKRFVLASPLEEELLEHARGYYSALGGDDEAFPAVRHEVVLGPGESLFLPVGYWHEVTSLDVSISFSLLAFRLPNAFGAYGPGFVG